MIKKNILVISNNPFSTIDNNGKTLASIFDNNSNSINQLYFSMEEPTALLNSNFFKITDEEMLTRLLKKKYIRKDNEITQRRQKKPGEFIRMVREVVWGKQRWKTSNLDEWLNKVDPDIVFFMGGDSGFAYNIVNYIVTKFNCKLITYITDDYIENSFSLNVFRVIRKHYIKKKMLSIFETSDKIYTISPIMRDVYLEKYEVKSEVLANLTNYNLSPKQHLMPKVINILYAGGLHYGRLNCIFTLAKIIKDENLGSRIKILIYTNSKVGNKKIRKYDDFLFINPSVNPDELVSVYQESDVLLHVESFKKKYIKKTKLSLSTKIPEYIMTNRLIFAIGPKTVGSMMFLENIALTANNKIEIKKRLEFLISDYVGQLYLIEKAKKKYKDNFKKISID